MARSDVALLLPFAPLLLVLTACASEPERSGRSGRTQPSPFGFELAMAGAGAATAGDGEDAPVPALIPLTPEELAARIRAGNVRLIDVRTAEEVAEGTIPGAEHVPLDSFDPAAIVSADGREVVFYCRTGRRSAIAGERLAAAVGGPVRHLEGGILAWEEAGQPVESR